ncbi:MAG: hypothetical protein E7429_07040 [Ruminococcaceae bacterium]|nr:hypothetical protein [Oscillospiraceae bacterium]
MKQSFGYFISFIEEVFFMGLISLMVSLIGFGAKFSMIVDGAKNISGFSDLFLGYLLISLFGYPVVMAFCILCQKFFGFYNDEYKGQGVSYILARNLYDDIAFPYYLLIAFFGILFNKKRGDSKVGTIIFFILWVLTLCFIVFGFKLTF